jgi:hypothetical protein
VPLNLSTLSGIETSTMVRQESNVPETNQMDTLPLWVDNLAYREGERIYEMMPSMFGERTQMIARLEAGIIDLLANEITKREG